LHRGQAVGLKVSNQLVGFIGTVHPGLVAGNKIRAEVAVGEFNLDGLLKKSVEKQTYRPFSRYPIVERDLAFLMPKSLSVGDVSREICEAAGSELQSLEIFDIYQGENMSANQKSAAFHLVFQSQDGTLQDEKVLQIMERITSAVKQKFSLTLR